jgi:mono/diheme cytochrome c family protein
MKNLFLIVAGLLWFGNCRTSAADKVDFVKDIQPILQQTCVKCHGPEKQKGKLRLDSKEATLKGGKDGPAFIAGDAEKSEMYRRITLPKGNDDIMPNEGDPLTKAQTDLIRDWINQGATWPDGVIIQVATTAPSSTPVSSVEVVEIKSSPAELAAVQNLKPSASRPGRLPNVNWKK